MVSTPVVIMLMYERIPSWHYFKVVVVQKLCVDLQF